ncbi:MAG TPA: cytochrome c biogenesis protein CcdA [Polyangiaceae bacterium]|jgi:thiol:disulfide interchange protein DsbD|nr:cytochrome c biogenesis protein CcdA [Polyangiaceae bacterium]
MLRLGRSQGQTLFAAVLSLAALLGQSNSALASEGGASAFSDALARGPAWLALAAFGFGLLVSLTPCVYPMVTITVSVFGAQSARSRWQAFALSFAFMLGLVAMFTPLGITAALTGKTFGSELSNPWVVVALSAFFLALAASMFGAFDLDLPQGLKNRLAGAGGAGYLGAFVLGLVCGPIAAPCTGPFLWGLLAWIAKTGSVALGSVAMASFAVGLGTPFFLVGALAMQLPKSGRWMVHVKSVMGMMLTLVALYFLGNAFPTLRQWARPGMGFAAICVVVVLVGIGFGAVHKSFDEPDWSARVSKALGILLVCAGGFGLVSGLTTPDRTLTWESESVEGNLMERLKLAKSKAETEGRPMFMDFTASWCGACKEIENKTFPAESVQRAAGRFIALQMDMSDDADPAVSQLSKQYEIRGLPTLILFDAKGQEARRFFGEVVTPEKLSEAMNAVN